MSIITLESTVGQLVTERPARARIFDSFAIDYCCGGKQPLIDACKARRLDPQTVLSVLRAFDEQTSSVVADKDWTQATMTELCDHIEQTHHAYLKQELPRLEGCLAKIAAKHGSADARLVELLEVFLAFRAELEQHAMKEERILFPLIRQLEAGDDPATFHCGSVNNPIRVMVLEHDHAGAAPARMRELTDGYQAPHGACSTYRATMDALLELERDMHRHVHKENHILFPRAAEVESAATAHST